jgi:hypothetical protein
LTVRWQFGRSDLGRRSPTFKTDLNFIITWDEKTVMSLGNLNTVPGPSTDFIDTHASAGFE